jgi:hypothetical protein
VSTGNGKGPERRPYRSRPFFDSAAFYAVLAAAGFGVLLLTGQNAQRAAGGAALAFVLATGATWFNVWRGRDRGGERAAKETRR